MILIDIKYLRNQHILMIPHFNQQATLQTYKLLQGQGDENYASVMHGPLPMPHLKFLNATVFS